MKVQMLVKGHSPSGPLQPLYFGVGHDYPESNKGCDGVLQVAVSVWRRFKNVLGHQLDLLAQSTQRKPCICNARWIRATEAVWRPFLQQVSLLLAAHRIHQS